jgi:hypothetical protein
MIWKIVCRFAMPAIITLLLSGCSVIDKLNLGATGTPYDPSKIYLQNERITIDNREYRSRFVCLDGPLMCNQFGLSWNCVCTDGL